MHDLLAAGAKRDEILSDYPYLEDKDVTAVLEFAARQDERLRDPYPDRLRSWQTGSREGIAGTYRWYLTQLEVGAETLRT